MLQPKNPGFMTDLKNSIAAVKGCQARHDRRVSEGVKVLN